MGAGHAYRCLTLAEALTGLGWRCYGVTNGGAAATVPALRGNPALTLGSEDSVAARPADLLVVDHRSEEQTSELQSLMRISYAVFCLKQKHPHNTITSNHN